MSTNVPLWKQALRSGAIGGAIVIFLALVGVIETFSQRYVVSGVITMSQIFLLLPLLLFGYTTIRKGQKSSTVTALLHGALSGLAGGFIIAVLVLIGGYVNLNAMFFNASPILYKLLTFNVENIYAGLAVLFVVGAIAGALGAAMTLFPERVLKALIPALVWMLVLGLMRDLLMTVVKRWGPVQNLVDWIFAKNGMSVIGALVIFLLIAGLTYWRSGRKISQQGKVAPPQTMKMRIATWLVSAVVLLFLPIIMGQFFSEILDNVGLYILMGLGLNIVVGYAGLLDLGYVAFFAIGAYTVGVLTSPELGGVLTFWQALPFALLAVVVAGVILGTPVLKMRGDYLAIVTMGFGEIIRLMALSDWLRPWLGGAQGIQQIASPMIGSFALYTQTHLYYMIVVAIGIVAFITWRLKDSHVGRSWMALREDEDVAQAMGINLVATKLMAFASGAFFAGLSGAIFAAKLHSAYPFSFNLLVSINVVALIIVGGMGSIPGVFIGAFALMGSPDLLREFAEFRYMIYGAVLVIMMLMKPEGLWPEERRKLELHEEEMSSAEQAGD
ncbi:MAG: hypothetical protein MUO77_07470 [Anaerolineales bacterium]|nr:hypothetical protein [Anaerolineales bacterium]